LGTAGLDEVISLIDSVQPGHIDFYPKNCFIESQSYEGEKVQRQF